MSSTAKEPSELVVGDVGDPSIRRKPAEEQDLGSPEIPDAGDGTLVEQSVRDEAMLRRCTEGAQRG